MTTSDTSKLRFTVRVRPVTYGDGRKFYIYRILAWLRGEAVGTWEGPSRTSATINAARDDGLKMVQVRKTHRLFIIRVTRKNIREGEARSCQSCAIAQSLWREQERMGFPRHEYDLRVEPYGFMADCDGIGLFGFQTGELIATGVCGMPDMVIQSSRGPYYRSMMEWAMEWDEYADSRNMTRAEWRETFDREKVAAPYQPPVCSFVLDVTAMESHK